MGIRHPLRNNSFVPSLVDERVTARSPNTTLSIKHIPLSHNMPSITDYPKRAPWSKRSKKNRWFFYMNAVVAIVILSAVVLLKDTTARYQPLSTFDSVYVKASGQETDPQILHKGIVYTEAARAHAYSSIIKHSDGTIIVGLIVAMAFVANSVFIFRLATPGKAAATK